MKKKGKNIGEKVLAVCAVIVLVVAVECYFNTKNYEDTTESGEDTVATEKGLELSDYIGMSEDEFLKATGFEKNEMGMYPDTEEMTAGIEDVTPETEENVTDTATAETTSGLQNVSAELSVLEENGFDTSILTTEEQVIVSYAKFIAISSAGTDQEIPVKTMRDIENEIYEYGFASDLVDYNSYGILNYYINCGIYQGLTTTAAEIIDDQYNIGDGWTVMEQVDYELDAEHM